MNRAYLITGGNMGNRLKNLQEARDLIELCCGRIAAASSLYRTAAWGVEDQPDFYNQVLLLQTAIPAEDLMQNLLQVEKQMGRERTVRMGPRTIDIDILFYNDDIINTEHLTVPHPRLQYRRFVLQPLAEIAPDLIHPVLKKTISSLLKDCTDMLDVYKIE